LVLLLTKYIEPVGHYDPPCIEDAVISAAESVNAAVRMECITRYLELMNGGRSGMSCKSHILHKHCIKDIKHMFETGIMVVDCDDYLANGLSVSCRFYVIYLFFKDFFKFDHWFNVYSTVNIKSLGQLQMTWVSDLYSLWTARWSCKASSSLSLKNS